MAATVADALFNRLIDAFPATRAYAAGDFAGDPMPEPLRKYFEHRISRQLDEAVAHESAWLDADDPDVRQARTAYRTALARHMRIPAAEWRSELALACRTVATYLIRPVPALTDLVFEGGQETASAGEVRGRLDALPAYPYFSEVISAYLDRKDLDRISRERFAGLARRIDHQMVRDFGADEWMDLLEPLQDVTRHLPEFSGAIPVDALRTFLKEKDAEALVARLDARFDGRSGSLVEPDELRQFLEQPAEREEDVADAGHQGESVRAAERVHGAGSSARGSHVPLWKQFESGLHHEPERSQPASHREASSPGRAAGAQPLWKQFRGGSAPHEDATGREKPVPREVAKAGEGATARNYPAQRETSTSRETLAPRESPMSRETQAPRETPASRHRSGAGEESQPHGRSAPGVESALPNRPESRESAANEWAPRGSSLRGTTSQNPHGEHAPHSDLRGGSSYHPLDDPPRDRDGGPGMDDAHPHDWRASESIPGSASDASAHARALEDLERSVLGQKGIRNRSLFLRHLFSGSERAYEDTLRKLYAAESWSEASQIIAREVFLKHQVNIYSDPAVAFTDAAEARFRR